MILPGTLRTCRDCAQFGDKEGYYMTERLPPNAAGVRRWVCEQHDKQLGLEVEDDAEVVSLDAARTADRQ